MHGIAGLVTSLPSDEAKRRLALMLGMMLHEPFYGYGVYLAPDLGFYVGWTDHRGEDPAARSVPFEHNAKVLVFAGEHFGDGQSEALPAGDALPGSGVAAAELLSRYDSDGVQSFRILNGWFAGALLDRRRQEVVVFTDRMGVRRIYYSSTKSGFLFASEAKAILAVEAESRELDPVGLGQFFAVGCPIGTRTLFTGVHRLLGGSAWTISPSAEVKPGRYFVPSELEEQPTQTAGEFYRSLDSTLGRAVPRYYSGDAQVALSLTGGFDSRAIVAFAAQGAKPRLAYTYGGLYRECQDVKVAREVARVSQYRHHVISIDRDFLRDFSRHAEETVWVTDGTADISMSHEIYLSRLARAVAPVRVTGNYGSEILRGDSTFKPLNCPRHLFDRAFWSSIEDARDAFSGLRGAHPVTFTTHHEIPCALFGRLAAGQCQLSVRSPYTDNELVALAYRRPRVADDVAARWTQLLSLRNPALAAVRTDRARMGTLPPARARVIRLINYLAFKAEWYYDGGMPDWLSAMDMRFGPRNPPMSFVGYHKIHNYRLWYRDEVADLVEDLLCGTRSRSRFYVNGAAVSGLFDAHRSGRRNCVQEITMFGTAELIQRLFVDGPPRPLNPMRSIVMDGVAVEPGSPSASHRTL